MRISIIGPTYPFRGGVAQYSTLLTKELAKRHHVLLVSFKRQYPDFLFPGKSNFDPGEPLLKDLPVEYIVDSMNPLTWESAVRRIKAYRPDMVLFHWWVVFWAPQFSYMAARLRKGIRAPEIVFLCHNVLEHESSLIKKNITRHVFSLADRFITHCLEETRRLEAILANETPIVTAFHPTFRDFCLNAPSKQQSKKRLGLSGDVLLFFGFVRKYKGLNVLLEAMSYVVGIKKVHLLVVGEFWEDKVEYLSQVERLNLKEHVTLVDAYVPNETARLYFAAADLVVQPYLHASGSGVAQLAYGFDRPVIATRVGSLPEVIEDRVNGRIVPPNDPQTLASVIIESLDPEILETLSWNCRQTKEKYSWEEMARRITGFPAART